MPDYVIQHKLTNVGIRYYVTSTTRNEQHREPNYWFLWINMAANEDRGDPQIGFKITFKVYVPCLGRLVFWSVTNDPLHRM